MTGLAGDRDDLPHWPFRLALVLGLELWGIFFAILHRGSGHSVSYDLAAAMAPSMLVALPLGFAARRWGREWWTPARLGTVLWALGLGGLLLTHLPELRESWTSPSEPHRFVAMPTQVGSWQQLEDAATILATDEQVEPLRDLDDPPAQVASRLFTTAEEEHVAQLVLITPDPKGTLRRSLARSRAGVVRDLLGGAGATRPRFQAVGSDLGGRLGCAHSATRGERRTATCAWAVHDVVGLVVFFADEEPSLRWAGRQARSFRDAVERAGS